MNTTAEAQALGARGFRVHPLKSKSQPYTKYSQTATSDPGEIALLFAPFPHALIGICTGSGLVVVDDDRRIGLDAEMARTCTLISTTPRNGRHYYFYCATPVRNSASRVAIGVDIRGEGGYVVAPPSEGRTWCKETHDSVGKYLTPLPGVLLAACLRSEPKGGDFEPRQHVPAGERHDYLVRFAGWALANELADNQKDLAWTVYDHAIQACEPWPKSEMMGVSRHIEGIARWVLARESGVR